MMGGMRARRLLLLSFFYVVFDLGCPMIPGAFSFDPAESVDAVSAYRLRPAAAARIVMLPPSMPEPLLLADPVRRAAVSPRTRQSVDWRPHAAEERATPSVARPSLDDD